jgi:hypothetical protein
MSHDQPPHRARDREASEIVDAWSRADHAHAFVPADHDAVEATRSLRLVVVDSLLREPGSAGRDLLHAFGALGRIIADRGGSPTLAASIVDGLLAAMGPSDAALDEVDAASPSAFAVSGRAAIAESYALARRAASREEARTGWDYPACVVPVDDGLVAIAAGCPDDDDEALTRWASGVARALTVSGVRRAVLSGNTKAIVALEEALDLAGVECVDRTARPAPTARTTTQR